MLFDDFDFSVLSEPDYLEDAVREDIVAPILKAIGYSPSGSCIMKRSKSLVHPFVKIGSKDHKVNIIPDYTLYIDGKPKVIIDAKKPSENIIKSRHTEQAYSYAIHPEIRCKIYGLCNGKDLVIYDVSSFEPILQISINEIDQNWEKVVKVLSPDYVLMPSKRDFKPDLGLHFYKLGYTSITHYFYGSYFRDIVKVQDNLFCTFTTCDFGEDYCLSLDYTQSILNEILSYLDADIKNMILQALSRQPFRIDLNGKLVVTVKTRMGELTKGAYEEFIPFIIDKIHEVKWDPRINIPFITE